jgi:hypothetical protein
LLGFFHIACRGAGHFLFSSAFSLSRSREGCLLWSFAYLAVRNLFALVWLLARPCRSKELEILVLRAGFAKPIFLQSGRFRTASESPSRRADDSE